MFPKQHIAVGLFYALSRLLFPALKAPGVGLGFHPPARALRDAIGLPFEIAEDVIEATEVRYEAPMVGEGEITSAAELLARASRELGLKRKDILGILEVSSLGEISDFPASWEKIKKAKEKGSEE